MRVSIEVGFDLPADLPPHFKAPIYRMFDVEMDSFRRMSAVHPCHPEIRSTLLSY